MCSSARGLGLFYYPECEAASTFCSPDQTSDKNVERAAEPSEMSQHLAAAAPAPSHDYTNLDCELISSMTQPNLKAFFFLLFVFEQRL